MWTRILLRGLVVAVLTVSAVAGDDVSGLLERIDTAQGRDRVIAIRACAGQDDPRIVERLADCSHDGSVAERMAAVGALGSIGGDAAVAALTAVAKTDAEPILRGNALEELGRLGHAKSFDLMVSTLELFGARSGTIDGLRLLGDPRGYDPILRVYESRSADAYVYEVAPAALATLDRMRAVPFLLTRFRDGGVGERYWVARALGAAPDPRVADDLLPELDGDDETRRSAAIRALAGAGDADVVERLVAHAEQIANDRPVTADALRTAPDGLVAADALVRWLGDAASDGAARAACAHALGGLDVKAAAPALSRALVGARGRTTSVRLLEALAELRDRRAIAAVAGALDDTFWVAQMPTISSVHGFPDNVRVSEVAAWALLTLRDGTEPFPRGDLFGFRKAPRPAHVGEALDAARAWWVEHREDEGFSFE